MKDGWVTTVAAVAGTSAIAAHHVGVDAVDAKMLSKDLLIGVGIGAGGGAAAGFVSRESAKEVLARTFVGGLTAAVMAPWLAETVLKVPTSSTSYPILCCSIGVLAFQVIAKIKEQPELLPLIGPALAKFAEKRAEPAVEGGPSQGGGSRPPSRAAAPAPAGAAGRPIRAPLL